MQALDSLSASAPVSAPKRAARARRAAAALAAQATEVKPLPRWARPPNTDPGAAAFSTGAGLALFDAMLRGGPDGGEPVYAGCLRQRLALRAAESCATLSRLREDGAALRDAEHLSGNGETSPAGRLHRVFRLLSQSFIAAALARAAAARGSSAVVATSASAPASIASHAHDAETLAFVVADLALANQLSWARPVPLLAVAMAHPSLRRGARERASRPRPSDKDWPAAVAFGYGLAVVEANALAVDLARRAQKIVSVAPMLRAKGAGRVVEMLLVDDAVTPAAAASRAGLSDRAARRLFDRLVALGAARKLTGRETFRIYGL